MMPGWLATRHNKTVAALLLAGSLTAAGPSKPATSLPKMAPVAGKALLETELPEAALLSRALPWETGPSRTAWPALATAPADKHQLLRWRMALAWLNEGFAAESLGMLDQMSHHDRGLASVANYRLSRGQALVLLGRHADAAEALAHPLLAAQPDACAWRLRALQASGQPALALAQARCAVSALDRMPDPDRAPFIKAMARAGLEADHPRFALDWLGQLGADDPETTLLRARALIADGKAKQGYELLASVSRTKSEALAAEAELVRISDGLKSRTMTPEIALPVLERLAFRWRGGAVEKEAQKHIYQLASERGDTVRTLASGAALIRHFAVVLDEPEFLQRYRTGLARLLDPEVEGALPVEAAAGLFWSYRDLAPAGAEGDLLAARLASRLETAGLPARAAELLEHQMLARVEDEARGPLSVRVANLFLRAGMAERALAALRRSERPGFAPQVVVARKQLESVALARAGRGNEAVAVLEGVPGSQGLIAEILWRMEDWRGLTKLQAQMLPQGRRPGPLPTEAQLIVVRQVIALTMLGDDAGLKQLRDRYAAALASQPANAAFQLLTSETAAPDPAQLAKAMAAISSQGPAGALGELLGPAQPARASIGTVPAQQRKIPRPAQA